MICKTLNDIIGHEQIVRWSRYCIENDSLPQVTLFTGPCGLGKTSIAKILACEIACKGHVDKLDAVKETVMVKRESTDCVKLYNLSNLKDKDSIRELHNDINVGLSTTGRKVLLLDEAHGMTADMQDALLVDFESLPRNVWVIVCTTELDAMRPAFISRCVPRRFKALSERELSELVRRTLDRDGLQFNMPINQVVGFIVSASGREARRVNNLISALPKNEVITQEYLISMLGLDNPNTIVMLVQYLYTQNILGLDLLQEMDPTSISEYFVEVTRILLGGTPRLFGRDHTLRIMELAGKDTNKWLTFAAKCLSNSRLTRASMQGYFLSSFTTNTIPIKGDKELSRLENMTTAASMIMETKEAEQPGNFEFPTLESILEQAPGILANGES